MEKFGKLELLSPKKILSEENLKTLENIRKYSLLENNRIGWNYPLDYLWINKNFKSSFLLNNKVLDIGCGPGAIHGWLEDIHNIDIIGLDLNRWERDYVDIVGDFNKKSLHKQYGWENNSFDIIFSGSSLEHQTPWMHYRSVQLGMRLLRPGGCYCQQLLLLRTKLLNFQNLINTTLVKRLSKEFTGLNFKNLITLQYQMNI